ncbi:Outer membrane protein assembly factor YaeT precursor [hydrothermal vent metagenome]|uniref:Outer membrane protein assembly factor YaeT n=1 Tax=hydrothermal vent metagenome TaxID=652676 RepID=A0A1W1BF98_9ZZZZ
MNIKHSIFFFLLIISFLTNAIEIKSIQVKGLQSISLGTVLNYLPLEVGDNYLQEDSKKIISSLYKTSFFKNIKVEEKQGEITIIVQENPKVSSLDIKGNTVIAKENLDRVAKALEISQGSLFSEYKLDKLIQQIESSYLAQGYYSSEIKKEINIKSNNTIDIKINIIEGDAATINSIKILGAHSYSEEALLKRIPIGTENLWTYFTENNKYSKVALGAGLERIKSFYDDNGFADFKINNTNVSLSANKKDVDIVIEIFEGEQYTFGEITLPESEKVTQTELEHALKIKKGELFNRKKVIESVKSLKLLVANKGYYSSNVDTLTNKNSSLKTIDIAFTLNSKKLTYINRINILGNTRTQDSVIRREIRQLEGSVYSESKINQSILKLKRLGYFANVEMRKTPVKGSNDLIDLTFIVKETKTGNFSIGLSESSNSGTSLNLGIAERNFLGSGNTLNANLSQSNAVKNYSFSFTNPFFTKDNHSISYGAFYKEVDGDKLSVSNYQIDSYGFNLGYGIPLSDETRINSSIKYTKFSITCGASLTLAESDQCSTSKSKKDEILFSSSWNHSTLNDYYFPSRGHKTTLLGSVALPGGDYKYYKIQTTHKSYYPIDKAITFNMKGNISYAKGYSDEELPFFKRFYAGGNSTVRGFKFNTLGPKYSYDTDKSKGGELLTTMGISLITPVPLVEDSKNMRLSAFIDAGNVYEISSDFKADELRSAIGLGFSWITPIGPLGFYLSEPLSQKSGDDVKRFEFSLGTTF